MSYQSPLFAALNSLLLATLSSSLMATAAFKESEPPKLGSSVQAQSDYELTQNLIAQAQEKLGDYERLADEYETFQELEERISSQPENRKLLSALAVCAKRLQAILQKRQLREMFSQEFTRQVDFYASMGVLEANQ